MPSTPRSPAGVSQAGDIPPLAMGALQGWLAHVGLVAPVDVEVVASTGSTNDDLLQRARKRRVERPIVRAADEQTSGRGRHGRRWVARRCSALLFSVATPLESLPAALPAVTLACGVALADRLIERGVPVRLKWPNDLLLDRRKIGGVLCELAVDGDGNATLVIGVGINGWLDEADRAAIGQPVACLSEVVSSALLAAEREAWIARLAGSILGCVSRYMQEGFSSVRPRYNELMDARGRTVDIVDEGRIVLSGRAVEVDSIGRLMISTATGLRGVNVGDVSLHATDDAAD